MKSTYALSYMVDTDNDAPKPDYDNVLTTGKRVLTDEADALHKLASCIDRSFVQAVRIFHECKGRVIVSGMGKSGHVARKIAATLASTGQPAFFVHPAEASHGDLGMIARDDCLLVLSNSGETSELRDLIAYTRRFSLPLIAITGGIKSSLATTADLVLIIPSLPEVGSLGLAPTTSTTMMLALGDALAVSLLDMRGFSADDFRNFHPGGKLGQSLLRVKDVMHQGISIPICKPNANLQYAIELMTAKGFGCVAVVDDDGKLKGIITDGDIRRHVAPDMLNTQASDVMTTNPLTCKEKTLAAEALRILNEERKTQLLVVDADNRPTGIAHIHDFLQAGIM